MNLGSQRVARAVVSWLATVSGEVSFEAVTDARGGGVGDAVLVI